LRSHIARPIAGASLNPEELSQILATLLLYEVEEGGPYAAGPDGEVDFGLNLLIALFLSTQGIRLPKLDAHLEERITSNGATSDFLSKNELISYLEKYEKSKGMKEEPRVSEPERNTAIRLLEEEMIRDIKSAAVKRFLNSMPALREAAEFLVTRTMAGNPDHQMSLMSLYVREALGEKGKSISDEMIIQLGVANVFFWSAFIVYDDFWDEDEAANALLLPVANAFARSYIDFFCTYIPERHIPERKPERTLRALFHDVMDRLDSANAWEISECRMRVEGEILFLPEEWPVFGDEYGDYSKKFYPAAGHVMGPVALFIECGFPVDSSETQALLGYFREYLIAMQLSDDAHDWKEDLRRGNLSTAVAELLRVWQKRYPDRTELNLTEDLPELEELFWFSMLRPFCERILAHTKRSRAYLQELNFLEKPEFLEKFIIQNENAANEALAELEFSEQILEKVCYPQVSLKTAKT
jgi:hypothetical protein